MAEINRVRGATMLVVTHDVNLALLNGAAIVDPEITALEGIVTVEISEEVERLLPKTRLAIVELTMKDGSVYTKSGQVLRGSPDAPVDYEVLSQKLAGCAQGLLSDRQIQEAKERVAALEEQSDIAGIIDCLIAR